MSALLDAASLAEGVDVAGEESESAEEDGAALESGVAVLKRLETVPSPTEVRVKLAVESVDAAGDDKGVSDAAEAAKARETKASRLEKRSIYACLETLVARASRSCSRPVEETTLSALSATMKTVGKKRGEKREESMVQT